MESKGSLVHGLLNAWLVCSCEYIPKATLEEWAIVFLTKNNHIYEGRTLSKREGENTLTVGQTAGLLIMLALGKDGRWRCCKEFLCTEAFCLLQPPSSHHHHYLLLSLQLQAASHWEAADTGRAQRYMY